MAVTHGHWASGGKLESDKESDGRLCEVGDFVEVQSIHIEIGRLKHKPAIFCANTKIARDIKVSSSAINERSFRLPINAVETRRKAATVAKTVFFIFVILLIRCHQMQRVCQFLNH